MRDCKLIVTLCAVSLILFLGTVSFSADIPALRDAKDSAERVRVQTLIEGARKENALVWTSNMIEPKQADHIATGFKEYYGLSQLKQTCTYSVSTEMIGRIEQVLKGGRTPPDIAHMPAWDWYTDLIKQGQLIRYDSPYYKDYTLSNEAGNSMPGYWVSDCHTSNPMWNIQELAKRGIKDFNPTSWWDFVDPKFSGLICLSNSTVSNLAVSWLIGMRKVVGEDWFIRVGKLKPALWTKSSQGEMWVASGEYPITLTLRSKYATRIEETGLEVGLLWPKEGQVLTPYLPVALSRPARNTSKAL